MIKADKHDTVKVTYIGRLANGTIFDQSPENKPLHFIIGKNEVIQGFEEAIIGMYQGESKVFEVPFQKAYGPSKPELIEEVQRSILPEDLEPQVGAQLEIIQHDGSKFYVMVTEINQNTVTLDANHPLAGKDLTFEITLKQVNKKRPEPVTS